MKIEEIVVPGFNPRPWLTGKCFDFALALHERMPDAEFVVIRSWVGLYLAANHAALRRGDVYYDARGAMPDVRQGGKKAVLLNRAARLRHEARPSLEEREHTSLSGTTLAQNRWQ